MGRHAAYEDAMQEAVMVLVGQRVYEDFRWSLIYHIPNGGQRNAVVAATLQRMGVKPGVPDLHWPIARHGYHSLYMELKCRGNSPSHFQIEWLQALADEGHCCVTVHDDPREALRILDWYLNFKGSYNEYKESFAQERN